jgi:hypothetical protein
MDNFKDFPLREPNSEELERAARVERAKQYGHDPTRKNWLQRYFEKREQRIKEPQTEYGGWFSEDVTKGVLDDLFLRLENNDVLGWFHSQDESYPKDNNGESVQSFKIRLVNFEVLISRGVELYSYDRTHLGDKYSLSLTGQTSSYGVKGDVTERYPVGYSGQFGRVASI